MLLKVLVLNLPISYVAILVVVAVLVSYKLIEAGHHRCSPLFPSHNVITKAIEWPLIGPHQSINQTASVTKHHLGGFLALNSPIWFDWQISTSVIVSPVVCGHCDTWLQCFSVPCCAFCMQLKKLKVQKFALGFLNGWLESLIFVLLLLNTRRECAWMLKCRHSSLIIQKTNDSPSTDLKHNQDEPASFLLNLRFSSWLSVG